MPFDPFVAQITMWGDEHVARVGATAELSALLGVRTEEASALPAPELAHLNDDQRRKSSDAAEQLAAALTEALGKAVPKLSAANDEIPLPDGIAVDISVDDPTVHDLLARLALRVIRRGNAPAVDELVRRSMLLLLVTDVELLIARLAGRLLEEFPDASGAGVTELQLTLKELEEVGSIDEARRLLITRRVDELMRQSLDDWVKWFKKFGVDWSKLVRSWPDFGEMWERRHTVVHSDGLATEQYLRAVRRLGIDTTIRAGDRLAVTDEYLSKAVQRVLAFGALLVAGTLTQLKRGPEQALAWLARTAQALLEERQFEAAQDIAVTALAAGARLDLATRLRFQVLAWTARKASGDVEQVHAEVREWDVRGLAAEFSHCKLVLLDELEPAVLETKELLDRGELSYIEFAVSPLYERLRRERGAAFGVPGVDSDPAQHGGDAAEDGG